ncbi:MAG: GNAT family N-acetyltransferase, partial [Planctomycetota bacterium]|nr:GNAT family N-acetyltransferase [Planctomycetota bacterium]
RGYYGLAMIECRIIRDRRDADVKSLGAISALSNEDPQSLQRAIEHFTGELNHLNLAETLLIGAYAGSELVGFCRFVLSPHLKLWWCRGLEVVPEWQRRGVGTALLVTALAHLRAGGAEAVRSDTSSRNHASQATHIRAGFVLIANAGEDFDGKWRDDHCYYQWDAQPAE